MGDGRRSGQDGGAGSAGRPLKLREIPGLLLAALGLAVAIGGSALAIHLVLKISWLASVAAAPLLLMAVTLVVKAVRKGAAQPAAAASRGLMATVPWSTLHPAGYSAHGARRLWHGRTTAAPRWSRG
jgi:hypothetical protein